MTLRTTVVPLGFGLSAVLGVAHAPAEDAPASRPAVRLYTNEDLDRVHAFRDETGVRSVPAVAPAEAAPRPAPERGAGRRGEEYWRREAARVRERVRALQAQAEELRGRIAEQAAESSRWLSGRRGRSSGSGSTSLATLRARLAGLERRLRDAEDDLDERARREGALPGWLR